ncbi:hypothetical protein HRbin40_01998 [bacterium HR40]|nr:hypothetical protein HRbin40_01998 [bacterium HR40]
MPKLRHLATMTALPLVLALTSGLEPEDLASGDWLPVALAQGNPCAPANPCAPRRRNPCMPAAANPCAPTAKRAAGSPCAAAQPSAATAAPLPQALPASAAHPFDTLRNWPEVPFGDAVDSRIPNYHRAAPHVATSGAVKPEDYVYVASLGFRTVINLRTDEEGAAAEAKAAEAAGLKVVRVPVAGKAPELAQVATVIPLLEDPANYPILLLCHTANRAGAMWALYRASRGVPAEIAIEEGRAAGLKPNREARVRELLGLPPLAGG